MNTVFADALFWIARVRPGDPWADAAKQAEERLAPVCLVTTDEVLTELLNALSSGGNRLRLQAVKMVHAILNHPNVRVAPQSRQSFLKGMDRYRDRSDKRYSLTDCISMNLMETEGLRNILTADHHFEQEGFTILLKK